MNDVSCTLHTAGGSTSDSEDEPVSKLGLDVTNRGGRSLHTSACKAPT